MNTKRLSRGVKRARRNLALKVALEQPFIRELKTYFNRLSRTAIERYRVNGEFITATQFDFGTQAVLSKQYRRVSRKFRTDLRDSMSDTKSFETKQDSQITATTNAALAVFILDASEKSSNIIDKTTENQIVKSFQEAVSEIENDPEKELTHDAISILGGIKMRRKFNSRVNAIAMSETQNAAEGTKFIEASVVSRDGNVDIPSTGLVVGLATVNKTWFSQLDNKVRPHHIQAHGQTVSVILPFVVNNQELMFPRDSSLGATADNVANCRCTVVYEPV